MQHQYPTIVDQFCKFEKEKSHRLFLSEPVSGVYRNFTWGRAGKEIRSIAGWLQNNGLKKGDKVAILSKNCAHWMMADMAIAMAGMVSVPLYPNITADAVREILMHSEAKLIFVGKLDNPLAVRTGIPIEIQQISFPFYFNEGCLNWDNLVQIAVPVEGVPEIDVKALSCIIYTSGTTGQPKGVMHSFHGISFAVYSFLKSNPPIENEIFFSYLPLCHVAERMLVECGAIFTGSTVHFVESLDTFSKNLRHTKPTIFLAVPRIWEKMQEEILKKMPQAKLNRLLRIPVVSQLIKTAIRKKLGLGRCKYLYTGASPINPSVLEWFARLGLVIQEAYGMTENSALSHSNRRANVRFGTVGQSYPGVDVKLGKDNEVLVRSEASMLGYYKEPELTAAMFEEDWLKTGDEGSIDAEGFLTITSRIKDQFKTSKGKYIIPAQIESKVLAHPYVSQACIVGSGMPAPLLLCTLSNKALVQEKPSVIQHLQDLLNRINSQLEQHERIARLIIMREEWTIDNGILTPTLKIKRKAIDALFQEYYSAWYNLQHPVAFI
ncbi:MAG TPA: AMP-binding protein [Sediminibacterium sp.]|nr:AMP-binding protein [Sediminibacterium sp.]